MATDMPGYGITRVAAGTTIASNDWVAAGSAFIDHELEKDDRPIFFYVLGAGGMLTYHVAAKNRKVR